MSTKLTDNIAINHAKDYYDGVLIAIYLKSIMLVVIL